ncbi:MAG: helix-turn-helix domain-containing protein, partial [Oscillospiraceae bacterium]|nr:helix-turn-helix domain-containing protein [Oscillospiraceae bacterium]
MKLNEKILYYRKAAKLSQEELAAQVGVSRQAVSKWELGDATPEVDKLLLLARAFGVTTDELLSGDEPPRPAPPRE